MTNSSGLYLYAIAPDSIDPGGLHGIDDAEIFLIADGGIAAVVSGVPSEKIRPKRKNLASHQHILKSLMSLATPLPIKFGIVAEDTAAINNLLKR